MMVVGKEKKSSRLKINIGENSQRKIMEMNALAEGEEVEIHVKNKIKEKKKKEAKERKKSKSIKQFSIHLSSLFPFLPCSIPYLAPF